MQLDNILKTSDDQLPFYWVDNEEYEKHYFATAEKFQTYLQNNDPARCGCDWLTQAQFDLIPDLE